ncbi:MAG: hypothetical protein ABH824_02825 [Nanoarchaeota archaeon]|nr:hypothetical protein [Nanoarchaeota archaeon]MBU1632088.1 hypothetical protein [Nanoarchaeota archaeon]MBU1875722.1 hypothetical protein [Nanoarchaeota archaeon]
MVQQKLKLLLVLIILVFAVNSTFAAIKTFHAKETDLVKITPEAIDRDNDSVVYYYSQPLDENGEWQTGYDDAGEYEIEITASDGINQTKQKINLIVENKNQPPKATEEKITIKEKQLVDIKEFVSDPDDDILTYEFNKPFDENGQWQTDYDDQGSYVTKFIISDDEFKVKESMEIEVLNTNQPPTIINSFSASDVVNLVENGTLSFSVNAIDKDGDEMTYQWKLDGIAISEQKESQYYFDFESSGEHNLEVTINDGINELNKEWLINVKDVNRKPELNILPITVNEDEKAVIDYPDVDLDGDLLVYSFADKFDDEGVWQTDFEDAGKYKFNVYASDGEFTVKEVVEVTVNDVDRAPELSLPQKIEVKEGEELSWFIDTTDLDGDEITIELENAPEGAVLDQEKKEFTWSPGYDFIRRKSGFFSNILNALRLENRILKSKEIPLTATSCGKELCISKSLSLVVYNVNRGPVLEEIEDVIATENENILLSPTSYDPDGDIVRYHFTEPFKKRSKEWKTGYGDRGEYIVYVTATDGSISDTIPVNIIVNKKNSMPYFNIEKDELKVDEGKTISFRVSAADPDDDELSISLENLPYGASFNERIFSWTPDYNVVKRSNESLSFMDKYFNDEEQVIWLQFIASDEEFDVIHPVKITVKDVNQKPEILDYLPLEEVSTKVGEPVVFHLAAKDYDNNKLSYQWNFGLIQKKVTGTDTIERTFTSPGEKRIKVKVSDGSEKVEKEWVVKVTGEEYITPVEEVAETPAVTEISDAPMSFYVKTVVH